jgi:hypothetical protein
VTVTVDLPMEDMWKSDWTEAVMLVVGAVMLVEGLQCNIRRRNFVGCSLRNGRSFR